MFWDRVDGVHLHVHLLCCGARTSGRTHAIEQTLDDLREAVTTLEDTERTARRVLGGAHPLVVDIGDEYRDAQAAFCARETLRPSPDAGRPSYNIPPWTMPLDDEYFI